MREARRSIRSWASKSRQNAPMPTLVDLDDPFLEKQIEADGVHEVLEHLSAWGVEAGARSPMYYALCNILIQAMKDVAVCVHAFQDNNDGLLRIQCYQPVDASYHPWPWMRMEDWERLSKESKPRGPDYREPLEDRMAWVQMYPLDASTWSDFEKTLAALAEAGGAEHGDRLKIRFHGKMTEAVLERRPTADIRLYFTDDRPAIMPKTRAQYEELGLPVPEAE